MLNAYPVFKCNCNFGLKRSSSNQFATQLGSGKIIFKPSFQGKKTKQLEITGTCPMNILFWSANGKE